MHMHMHMHTHMCMCMPVQVLRQPALAGRASVKPWKLTLRRDALCADVLAAMSKVRGLTLNLTLTPTASR